MHMLPCGMRDPHPLSRSIKKRHSLLGGPFEFNKRLSSSKISRVMLVFGQTVVSKMKMFLECIIKARLQFMIGHCSANCNEAKK